MSDDLQVKGGVVGASAPTAPTALSSADADQAASRLAPHGLQSTGAWASFAERHPEVAGVFEWRVPSRAVSGIVVQFFCHMRKRGNGYGPDILSPLFDHWDGYRVTVPAGTEWREAANPPPCKDYSYAGLTVEGIDLDPCPFCHKVPTLHANDTSPSGGVAIGGNPHRFNTWWLECCSWVRTFGPRFNDPRKLAEARHKALFPASVDTHAKRGDAAQTAAPFMSGAVASAQPTTDAQPIAPSNEPEHD